MGRVVVCLLRCPLLGRFMLALIDRNGAKQTSAVSPANARQGHGPGLRHVHFSVGFGADCGMSGFGASLENFGLSGSIT
jgi:hypothetical protein